MFMEDFKYYKSKKPQPKLDNVINFYKPQDPNLVKKIAPYQQDLNYPGLIPCQQWEIYELVQHPGLIFVKNPFTSAAQRYWVVRCLKDYPKKPNKTNLDAQNMIPDNAGWWDFCSNSNNSSKLKNKLRWVTFGYQHNWDTKEYSEESKSAFPQDLSLLTQHIAKCLGFDDFNPEAAIVNYYHMDSTLSAHTDHSEPNVEAPLFSLSFGQNAIFLLGGVNKDTKPAAMLLRSGDIVVMSKEARLSYHAVPKILCAEIEIWNFDGDPLNSDVFIRDCNLIAKNKELWQPFNSYLSNCRININIRQVLKIGQNKLK